ncbi:hypothetical protein [Rubeoparvulum massiliense]|uniref:hypothetical protein n=1 Tax=Rubeoparvulum massiliense TaxID=1631346 RepID=UPI00065E6C0A|nr:hypothetical protein [Rubeoparvulum massiliense]
MNLKKTMVILVSFLCGAIFSYLFFSVMDGRETVNNGLTTSDQLITDDNPLTTSDPLNTHADSFTRRDISILHDGMEVKDHVENDGFKAEEIIKDLRVVNKVQEHFQVDGYVNIIDDRDDVVGVPKNIVDKNASYNEGTYPIPSRHFIYKNIENGMVILMSITPLDTNQNEWKHTIGYLSYHHNSSSPESDFKETYSDTFPNSNVYLFNFIRNGNNFALVGIGDHQENLDTFIQLTEFTRELGSFLDNENF